MTADGGVRGRLRAATDAAHQALHRAAPFAAIADGTATRDGYGQTLIFLHRYHSAMAPLCARGAAALGTPRLADAHEARLAALVQDLDFLALAPEPAAGEAPGDDGFCVGALYTVQGSVLGGKLIHRQLEGLLPGADGRRFFAGGAGDGQDWRLLCAALDGRSDLARLEAGALHAFARFGALMAKPIVAAST